MYTYIHIWVLYIICRFQHVLFETFLRYDEMWVQVATQLTTHVHNYLVISFSEGQPGTMWSLFEGMENPRLSKPGEVGNKTHRHLQPVIRCRCQAMLMVALVACWTGHGMLVPCVVWMASWQTAEGICFERIPCVRDKQVQLWHFLLTSPPFLHSPSVWSTWIFGNFRTTVKVGLDIFLEAEKNIITSLLAMHAVILMPTMRPWFPDSDRVLNRPWLM